MPATLAKMLMMPMETAAAEDDSVCVGRTQNGDGQAKAKNPVRHSQTKTASQGWPGRTLPARHSPANTWPATQCHLRSPVSSDDRPDSHTPARPQANTGHVHRSTSAS